MTTNARPGEKKHKYDFRLGAHSEPLLKGAPTREAGLPPWGRVRTLTEGGSHMGSRASASGHIQNPY